MFLAISHTEDFNDCISYDHSTEPNIT